MRQIITSVEPVKNRGCRDAIILNRLNAWFTRYCGQREHSCGSFLYWMMTGMDPCPIPPFWTSYPSEEPTNWILLDDRESTTPGTNHHYASFLPEIQCYVSQYGNGGAVILSDLTDMQTFFETTTVEYIATMQPCFE